MVPKLGWNIIQLTRQLLNSMYTAHDFDCSIGLWRHYWGYTGVGCTGVQGEDIMWSCVHVANPPPPRPSPPPPEDLVCRHGTRSCPGLHMLGFASMNTPESTTADDGMCQQPSKILLIVFYVCSKPLITHCANPPHLYPSNVANLCMCWCYCFPFSLIFPKDIS